MRDYDWHTIGFVKTRLMRFEKNLCVFNRTGRKIGIEKYLFTFQHIGNNPGSVRQWGVPLGDVSGKRTPIYRPIKNF
jgi:hypothetical protein